MWLQCTDCGKTGQHTDFNKDGLDRVCPDCEAPTRLTSEPDDGGDF